MISIVCALSAAACSSTANLIFRKNSVAGNESPLNAYLMFYYASCFILAITFSPHIWTTPINFTMLLIGSIVGTFNIVLMQLISQALQKGPAGLTFAFQNSSSILPGIILFWIFGYDFGYTCTFWHVIGVLLILTGLYMGAFEGKTTKTIFSTCWFKYVLACFLIQIITLTILQGRCVLFECDKLNDFLLPFAVQENDDAWLLPGQFGTCFIIQILLFLRERRDPKIPELVNGTLGGFANFAGASLLLLATKWASPSEKSILLPCFAISTIIICNLWANRLYSERFKVTSNATCALGILVGSW